MLLLPVYSAENWAPLQQIGQAADWACTPRRPGTGSLPSTMHVRRLAPTLLRWGLKLPTHASQLRAATSALSQCPRCSWMCPKRCTSTVRSDPPRLEDIRGLRD